MKRLQFPQFDSSPNVSSSKLLQNTLDSRNKLPASNDTDNARTENQSSRRTTVDIYADILEVVKRHGGHGRITRISYGVGMPVDRLKRFLDRLEKFGLVRSDNHASGVTYLVTIRGQEFLGTFWKMKGFLEFLGEVDMRDGRDEHS